MSSQTHRSELMEPVLTADEAGLMEAPPIALDLLCVVHRLLTGCTLGSSTPVWHLIKYEIK